MTKELNSEQTIGNLTKSQLEEIIKEIAQKTFKQEMKNTQENKSQALASTFGTWEDEKKRAYLIFNSTQLLIKELKI